MPYRGVFANVQTWAELCINAAEAAGAVDMPVFITWNAFEMGVGSGNVSPMWSSLMGLAGSGVFDIRKTLYFLRSGRHISATWGVTCDTAAHTQGSL